MNWYSFGCKCGAAVEIRSEKDPRQGADAECPSCGVTMVFLASWKAGGARYDAKGIECVNAIKLLVDAGMSEENATGLLVLVGPAMARSLVANVQLMLRQKP